MHQSGHVPTKAASIKIAVVALKLNCAPAQSICTAMCERIGGLQHRRSTMSCSYLVSSEIVQRPKRLAANATDMIESAILASKCGDFRSQMGG